MVQYIVVGLLSALLGGAELISRYRDDPNTLAKMPATYLYLVFNVLVGCAALYLIGVFGLTPDVVEDGTGADPGTDPEKTDIKNSITNVLIAGFGGAAFFRSSVARTKVGDVEIGVGPSFVIDAFLGATDRAIDRRRASIRTERIPNMMRPITPDFAAGALTQYCIGAMQNLSAADEKALETRAATYANANKLPLPVRSMLIGMTLSEYVGEGLLEQAIETLEQEIAEAQEARQRRESTLNVDDLESQFEEALPADARTDRAGESTSPPTGVPVPRSGETDTDFDLP